MTVLGVGNQGSVVDKAIKKGIDREVSDAVINLVGWSCIVPKGGELIVQGVGCLGV
jgi:hypothetical protein